jgi:hypothetical protein
MWIKIDPAAPDGFVAGSFAGDDWRDCKDYIQERLGRARWQPAHQGQRPATPKIGPVVSREDDTSRTKNALAIWGQTVPLAGTLGDTYLRQRLGVGGVGVDLRFHHKCPRGAHKLPALVALLRDIRTDEPKAIQRIFLQDDGRDRLRDTMGKATLGPAAGTVCKLSPDEATTHGIGLTEGVEKGLALLAIGWAPIWVTCGTSNMSAFPVLNGIEVLTIFADHDEAGQKAARICGNRWAEKGTEVHLRTPTALGADWNDAIGAPI